MRERYGWYLAGGVALILAQSLLIAGLLLQRLRRLRAQGAACRGVGVHQREDLVEVDMLGS